MILGLTRGEAVNSVSSRVIEGHVLSENEGGLQKKQRGANYRRKEESGLLEGIPLGGERRDSQFKI